MPSRLLQELYEAIARLWTIDEDAEVTIEANPDDVTREWLRGIEGTPVNRISMGAQTFSDRLLRFIGRRHNAQQTIDAVRACKEAGITNISLDLIYGLPGQTFEDWQRDVEQALSLGITHLSAYELSWQMYDYLMTATSQAGFLHYEISNFALPGYHSRHNSSYWQGVPYLGLGAGAHSYDGQRSRRANLPDIKAYISATNDVPHETELLSDTALYNEFIMTRLRTSKGVPLDELPHQDRLYCLSLAEPHLKHKLLHINNGHLCLAKEGIFTSNDIISDLLKVDN